MKFQKLKRKVEDPAVSKWLIDLEAIHERIQLKKDKRKAELAMLINEDKSVQIHEARQMLVIDDFTGINQRFQRILQLDPSFIYEALDDQLAKWIQLKWQKLKNVISDTWKARSKGSLVFIST